MAIVRGIDAVKAALAGKRMRIRGGQAWCVWDSDQGKFCRDDGEMWIPSSRQLLTYWWEVEEPTMTFTEAVAAMDAGQIVTREPIGSGMRGLWFRRKGSLYEVGGGPTTEPTWFPYGFTPDEIHATDWRVVAAESREAPKDERPTFDEALDYVFGGLRKDLGIPFTAETLLKWALSALRNWKPGMFRKVKAWKAPERVPAFLEMDAPQGAESEEKS